MNKFSTHWSDHTLRQTLWQYCCEPVTAVLWQWGCVCSPVMRSVRVALMLLWMACAVNALDVCVLGVRGDCAATLVARLVSKGHRVATWDELDEEANRRLMRQGAVASFSQETCIAFGAVINVCDDDAAVDGAAVGDKPVVFWTRENSRPDVYRGSLDTGLVVGPENALLEGDVATMAIALLPAGATVDVDDEGRVSAVPAACPPQAPGGPTLWTRVLTPSGMVAVRLLCRCLVTCIYGCHRVGLHFTARDAFGLSRFCQGIKTQRVCAVSRIHIRTHTHTRSRAHTFSCNTQPIACTLLHFTARKILSKRQILR